MFLLFFFVLLKNLTFIWIEYRGPFWDEKSCYHKGSSKARRCSAYSVKMQPNGCRLECCQYPRGMGLKTPRYPVYSGADYFIL